MAELSSKNKRAKAMTMIEMLIVVSIMTILGGALYNALAGGIRVWQRANQVIVEEDALVFFEKFSHDLNNIYFFSKMPIDGGELRFAFPSVVQVRPDKNRFAKADQISDQLGMFEYYFDMNNRKLMRRQANYSQALSYTWETPLTVISGVKQMKFQYFYFTDGGEQVSDAAFNSVPSGIEIKLEIESGNGSRALNRYFSIPIGN